ncbi:hypothetical protein [Solicola gregarius]|uniref:Uncharacterized protein n=1 Tax=Solicola gregarius TaxID=2908642 RepID=A0AA46TH01_9ACTN|nr:hypothetical protein [Solicola gregarius]UYM04358.1 hypothetical protein L0C25_17715 [Solicola gregarius]
MRTRIVGIAAIGTLAVCGTALTPPATGSSTLAEREHRAENTAIQPGSLDKGKRPQALYMQGRRIYDGKRAFKVRGPKGLSLVGKGDGGYLAVRYGMYDGHLWQIRPHRKARRLGGVAQAAYNGGDRYTVSDDGKRLAITEPERTGKEMLWVRALPSGKQLRFRWRVGGTRAVAFPKNRVLLTNLAETYWYAPKQNKRTFVTDSTAVLAEPGANRMVLLGSEPGEDNFRLVAFDETSTLLAGWNKGRPLVTSPNGKRFLAKVGKHKLQVRSLDDGAVVRTFSAAGRIDTASARWESGRRVLFTAKGHKVAANVRCTVGGDCVRTTRLVKRPGQLGIDWPQ